MAIGIHNFTFLSAVTALDCILSVAVVCLLYPVADWLELGSWNSLQTRAVVVVEVDVAC